MGVWWQWPPLCVATWHTSHSRHITEQDTRFLSFSLSLFLPLSLSLFLSFSLSLMCPLLVHGLFDSLWNGFINFFFFSFPRKISFFFQIEMREILVKTLWLTPPLYFMCENSYHLLFVDEAWMAAVAVERAVEGERTKSPETKRRRGKGKRGREEERKEGALSERVSE
jgi:hypothetical protein